MCTLIDAYVDKEWKYFSASKRHFKINDKSCKVFALTGEILVENIEYGTRYKRYLLYKNKS